MTQEIWSQFTWAIYGLSYLILGVSVVARAGAFASSRLRNRLFCLATFAIIHALFDWLILANDLHNGLFPRTERYAIEGLSFIALFYFASGLRGRQAEIVHLVVGLNTIAGIFLVFNTAEPVYLEMVTHLGLGLPAGLYAAYALMRDPTFRPIPKSPEWALRLAALSLAGFALTQIVLLRAGFFPASVVNNENFEALFGISLFALRASLTIVFMITTLALLNRFDAAMHLEATQEAERTHHALRVSEARLSDIFKRSPEGIIVTDELGHITMFSAGAETIFGYKAREIIGRGVEFLMPDRYRALHHQHIKRFATGPDASRSMGSRGEVVGLRTNGEEFPMEASLWKLTMPNGVMITTMVRDISQQKAAHEELRNAKLRAEEESTAKSRFAENLPGFLFQCFVAEDESIRFKLIGTPKFDFGSFHEESSADHEGVTFNFVHPEDRPKLQSCIFAAYRSGSDWSQTVRIVTPNGPERWVHITALVRRSDTCRNTWDGIALDETDRIAIAAQNAQLQAKLRQAEKMEAIGTLAGGVAHELNNLLQPIIMMTELVLTELPQESRHITQLSRVVDAGGKAAEIVQRILAFGRVDEASHSLLDMSFVAREAIAFIRTILPSSITLNVEIDAMVGKVRGDKTQLTQILINFATNARDAIGANVGTVWVSLSRSNIEVETAVSGVGTLKRGAYATLTVRDTGSGMDEATEKRIFEPFFTTKGVGKGTGLGLSVTHGIVAGHGGAIQVDSAPGRGTSFSMYLPIEGVDVPFALTG